MISNKQIEALERPDLTSFLVHLTKAPNGFETLKKILTERRLRANPNFIKRLKPVVCFYEVPPDFYMNLIRTNPNNRCGFGIMVNKIRFWERGGRPVI